MGNETNDHSAPISPYNTNPVVNGTTQAPFYTADPISNGQPINPGYDGLPSNFPINSLLSGMGNIQSLYNGVGSVAPSYYQQAQGGTNQATDQGLSQLGNIYGQAMNQQGGLGQQAQSQIAGLENQNLGQVNDLLNNYNQSFVQSLGPNGQLGSQLTGEFNNLGITPQSGAFQSALGNQLGTLGAQNALTLGQQALQPGINAQYGALNSTLASQLGLSGQGASQAGTASNAGTLQNQGLGSQGALSPLNYANQALTQESGLLGEITQAPVDFWNQQQGLSTANAIQDQNQAAQNSASQNAMTGQLGSSALMSAAMLAAK